MSCVFLFPPSGYHLVFLLLCQVSLRRNPASKSRIVGFTRVVLKEILVPFGFLRPYAPEAVDCVSTSSAIGVQVTAWAQVSKGSPEAEVCFLLLALPSKTALCRKGKRTHCRPLEHATLAL